MKTTIATNRENSTCQSTIDTKVNTVTGKYGTAVIDDVTPNATTHCIITYTVKGSGVSDRIKDGVVKMKVDNDSSALSVAAGTTVDQKYLPTALGQKPSK